MLAIRKCLIHNFLQVALYKYALLYKTGSADYLFFHSCGRFMGVIIFLLGTTSTFAEVKLFDGASQSNFIRLKFYLLIHSCKYLKQHTKQPTCNDT